MTRQLEGHAPSWPKDTDATKRVPPYRMKRTELEQLVDRILAATKDDPSADVNGLEREIDDRVYRLYGLTKEEIKIVEGEHLEGHAPSWPKDTDATKRVPPVRLQQTEIEQLVDRILAATKDDPSADVNGLEREIDDRVYRLYGLTKEEIKIVEGES